MSYWLAANGSVSIRLLKNNPSSAGIMLNYEQATNGQPRMVFSFDFVAADKLSPTDEG